MVKCPILGPPLPSSFGVCHENIDTATSKRVPHNSLFTLWFSQFSAELRCVVGFLASERGAGLETGQNRKKGRDSLSLAIYLPV